MVRKQVNVRLEEGLVGRIEAARGDRSLQAWFGFACEHALGCSLALSAGATVASTAVGEGWKGSERPGHRDVPELGWYRPTSFEARKDVPLDLGLLERAKAH